MTYLDKDQVLAALERLDIREPWSDGGKFYDVDDVDTALAALPAIPLDRERIIDVLEALECMNCHRAAASCICGRGPVVLELAAVHGVRALPVLETKKETT